MYQENSQMPIIISILALFISGLSFYFPLLDREANLVIYENNIEILNIEDSDDSITHIIKNIGGVEAKNIEVSIYTVPFDENLRFQAVDNPKGSVRQDFHDSLVHPLPANAQATIGQSKIPTSAIDIETNATTSLEQLPNKQVALIFHIHYTETLLCDNQKDAFFFFQYAMGESQVGTLIKDDYRKIHNRLLKGANWYKNQKLVNYLESNLP